MVVMTPCGYLRSARGYSGSYDTARYARRFRQAQGTQQRKRRRSIKQLVSEPQNFLLPRRCTSGTTATGRTR